jgi:histidinol phosphatase-like enzyme
MLNRSVLLDRDGTLIEDRGYIHRTEQVKLLPGVVQALSGTIVAADSLLAWTKQLKQGED